MAAALTGQTVYWDHLLSTLEHILAGTYREGRHPARGDSHGGLSRLLKTKSRPSILENPVADAERLSVAPTSPYGCASPGPELISPARRSGRPLTWLRHKMSPIEVSLSKNLPTFGFPAMLC